MLPNFISQFDQISTLRGAVEVDWNNPITRGLTFAAVVTSDNKLQPLYGLGYPTTSTGTFTGAGYSLSGTNKLIFPGDLSVFSQDLGSICIGHRKGQTASHSSGRWIETTNFNVYGSSGVTFSVYGSSPANSFNNTDALGEKQNLILRWDSANSKRNVTLNGDSIEYAGAFSGTATASDLNIFNNGSGTRPKETSLQYIYIWNRYLSAAETRQVYVSPYTLVKPSQPSIFIISAGAGISDATTTATTAGLTVTTYPATITGDTVVSITTANVKAPSGYTTVTLSGTITADGSFTVQPVANDQVLVPAGVTCDAQLNISGSSGTYTLYHVIASTGVIHNTPYTIADSGAFTTTASVNAGGTYTTVALASGFDAYVFEGWSPQPVVGEQLTTLTADGYFDTLGNYYSELEHVHDAWFTNLDGTTTHFNLDSTGLGTAVDTYPDAFSFTSLVGQSLSTQIESSEITVAGVSAATNIAVSVTSGSEYAVSTDGSTFGAWQTAAGNVQLGNTVKLRTTTSSSYNDTRSVSLDIGGRIGNWSVSTITANTTPDPFTLNSITDASISTSYESVSIAVLGVVSGYDVPVTVTSGEYAVSTNNGENYGAWTSSAGTVQLGNLVKVRHTTSSSFSTEKYTTLSLGGVTSTFTTTTAAVATDVTPDQFNFTSTTGVSVSTLVESDAITITGIGGSATVNISVTNGEYAKSTDSGESYGSWTSATGTAALNDLIKVRHTSSSTGFASKITTLTASGISASFTSTTNEGESVVISGTVNVPSVRTITLGSKRTVSNRVFTQDITDKLDYSFDFTNWLATGDTVNAVAVVDGQDCVTSGSFTGTHVMGWLTCPSMTYASDAQRITFRVGTTDGAIVDVSFYLAFVDM